MMWLLWIGLMVLFGMHSISVMPKNELYFYNAIVKSSYFFV